MTFEEVADRLAIRELVDAYAHCADRRDCEGQMALFTKDAHFVVFMDAKSATPNQTIASRADLRPVFEDLRRYDATTHFNGQSTIVLNGASATGESYCLAHHVQVQDGRRSLMVASLRYLDTFAKQAGRWLFSERRLMVDWIETRAL
jgi:ketosteroid isomerase-like protein